MIFSGGNTFISPKFKFSSNSLKPLNIIINDFVALKKLKNVSAFTLIAESNGRKIPTRLNHQLIYSISEYLYH